MRFRQTLLLIMASANIAFLGIAGHIQLLQADAQIPRRAVPNPPEKKPQTDDVFQSTPQVVVDEMLELVKMTKDDVIYELGYDQGLSLITAGQKYGARGIAIVLLGEDVQEGNANAKKAGVADRVKFIAQEWVSVDLSPATVVILHLPPGLALELRPQLKQLKPGTRVVSHEFDMGDWKPDRVVKTKKGSLIYLWTIPK